MRKALICLLFAVSTMPAAAREVAGVKLPESVTLGQPPTTLVLNGAGIRKKFFVKVYVGALYLSALSRDAKAILAMAGPKSVHMHFLYDEVSAEKLADGWTDGFRANQTEARFNELKPRLNTFNAAFVLVRRGDTIRLDYVPGTGTEVWIRNEKRATIPGEDFSQALLAVWLGEEPADSGLKDAMLGGEP
jgi:hypothetical protein